VPRDYHARLIRTLDAAQPAIIGLDFYFLQETDPKSDRIFKETIRTASTPIVIGAVTEKLTQFTAKQFAYQKQFLADVGRPGGDIALNFAEDRVTRRTYDASKNPEYPETFARRIARLAGAQVARVPQEMHVGWLWGARSNPYPFLTIAAQDLRSEQPNAVELQKQLKGKIVLVGLNFPYFDQHRTPLSVATKEGMLGVMIHGQMIAQLLDSRIYSELGLPEMAGFLAGVIVLGLLLGWIFWKHASLLGQSIAAVALVSLDAVLYYFLRIYLPLTPALYVWFLAVLAGSNLRVLIDWAKERRTGGREFAVQSA
jgi:CHASE2 domain-containing sensor protein